MRIVHLEGSQICPFCQVCLSSRELQVHLALLQVHLALLQVHLPLQQVHLALLQVHLPLLQVHLCPVHCTVEGFKFGGFPLHFREACT